MMALLRELHASGATVCIATYDRYERSVRAQRRNSALWQRSDPELGAFD
jgi:hypothetical protein